jgi:hypothetical protein
VKQILCVIGRAAVPFKFGNYFALLRNLNFSAGNLLLGFCQLSLKRGTIHRAGHQNLVGGLILLQLLNRRSAPAKRTMRQ